MRFLIVLVAALALAAPALGKTYDRVSLAEELLSLGVPKSELPIWTCIAEHESSYRTDLVGLRNTDGSYNHGLFQINDHYWCTATGRYSFNKCNIHCDVLRSDDIRSSVACARSIKEEQGFKAWASWKFCNGKLPSINNSPRKHIGWKSVATINIYLVLRYFFWNFQ